MDRNVPAGAARLLDFIRDTEVGTEARAGYDIIFGHNQGKLPKAVTAMTVDEVLAAQGSWSKRFGSSATGGYQFMRATLDGLKSELKLRGSQMMEPNLQDRLGYHLLKRRGYEAFVSGRIDRTEFAKRLAQEWASFPVLVAVQGAHRQLTRGQSYYAGDGLNKALMKPEAIEGLLAEVLELAKADALALPVRPEVEIEILPPATEVAIPAAPAQPASVAVDKPLSPIEQMNKPVKGAIAGTGAMTIGGSIVVLMQSAGWLPAAWESGAPAVALGVFSGWAFTQVGNFLGAYFARDKRFQPSV
ncbi:hypothetical protein [Aureimonas sp. ME7]|uniref:hypothetical protein n=1 Tax=Aureimonas sp. ME7 TaxID=2744252 RepID=UPI0015FB4640|nr:hypothetical protein [Aureimonas sp. ME7]